jgi:hypothetical protein
MDRKLTTIFASDVVGFSKMMGEDEVKTLKILKERRAEIALLKKMVELFLGVQEIVL